MRGGLLGRLSSFAGYFSEDSSGGIAWGAGLGDGAAYNEHGCAACDGVGWGGDALLIAGFGAAGADAWHDEEWLSAELVAETGCLFRGTDKAFDTALTSKPGEAKDLLGGGDVEAYALHLDCIHAGEDGHGQETGRRWVFGGGFGRGTEHGFATPGVQSKETRAYVGDGADGPSYGVGDVVEFEVQEDLQTAVAEGFNQRIAGGAVEFEAYLHPAAGAFKAVDEVECFAGRLKIEGNGELLFRSVAEVVAQGGVVFEGRDGGHGVPPVHDNGDNGWMRTVLTIAGFDPSSGAGVTADLAVFAAHGMFGTSCITALTVQNTVGVVGVHPVGGTVVGATLLCLQEDLPPVGIKIGMLATAGCIEAVAEFLEGLKDRPVVVLDPVLRSTSGRELLDGAGLGVLREKLLPLVDWVTPNAVELEVLGGLVALQGNSVIVTGGDRETPDDLVVVNGSKTWLPGVRVETTSTHGTGCALSSALLCRLLMGDGPVEAARAAKEYVTEALRRATPMGQGHGPMNHLWPLRG
jgi:hydroxymethylpyrimidine/phosphomethylpyrimidine kinase